jgi:hypothetical protein
VYTTKPQLAIELLEEVLRSGLRFSVVLADSLSGESGPFISALHRLRLQYVVAIRSNHGVWMLPDAAGPAPPAHPPPGPSSASSPMGPAKSASFARPSSARAGWCAPSRSPPIRETLPPETTWDLMTNQPGKIDDTVGHPFGWRTWIE